MQEKGSSISLHGTLVDILGVGVLLLGKSGIGKSECALELIMRGHSLVVDDLIRIEKVRNGDLFGFSHDLGRHHMEVKGLGLIDVEKLFGIAATREQKRIGLAIEFLEPDAHINDHVGLSEETYTIMGVSIPRKRIPVRPGRNLAALVEVATRDYLLKQGGYHVAREFEKELLVALKKKGLDEM